MICTQGGQAICTQGGQAICKQGGQHATRVRPDPPPRCEIHLPTVPRLPDACRACLCGIYSAIRDASIVTLVIGIQRAGRRRAPDGYGLGTRTLFRRMDRIGAVDRYIPELPGGTYAHERGPRHARRRCNHCLPVFGGYGACEPMRFAAFTDE
jgi:hypothetical protein